MKDVISNRGLMAVVSFYWLYFMFYYFLGVWNCKLENMNVYSQMVIWNIGGGMWGGGGQGEGGVGGQKTITWGMLS